MEDINILLEIGLTTWEAKAYLSLVELGSTTTGPLVKKSEVPQCKIYGVLESLQNKGLVSYIIKGKIKYYQAADPKKVLNIYQEKENKIKQLLKKLEVKKSKNKQSVELFEGLKSIRLMLVDLISKAKKTEEWIGFGSGDYSEQIRKFYNWWGPRRTMSGLNARLLIPKQDKTKVKTWIRKKSLKKFEKITKYSNVPFPGDVFIYKDNIVILNWDEIPTAILIQSKNLADQYKSFFEAVWKLAKN